jgi:hypothetical protein
MSYQNWFTLTDDRCQITDCFITIETIDGSGNPVLTNSTDDYGFKIMNEATYNVTVAPVAPVDPVDPAASAASAAPANPVTPVSSYDPFLSNFTLQISTDSSAPSVPSPAPLLMNMTCTNSYQEYVVSDPFTV